MKTKAFTLIEILSVVAIVSLLAAILIPTLAKKWQGVPPQPILGLTNISGCSINGYNVFKFDYEGHTYLMPGTGGIIEVPQKAKK